MIWYHLGHADRVAQIGLVVMSYQFGHYIEPKSLKNNKSSEI